MTGGKRKVCQTRAVRLVRKKKLIKATDESQPNIVNAAVDGNRMRGLARRAVKNGSRARHEEHMAEYM